MQHSPNNALLNRYELILDFWPFDENILVWATDWGGSRRRSVGRQIRLSPWLGLPWQRVHFSSPPPPPTALGTSPSAERASVCVIIIAAACQSCWFERVPSPSLVTLLWFLERCFYLNIWLYVLQAGQLLGKALWVFFFEMSFPAQTPMPFFNVARHVYHTHSLSHSLTLTYTHTHTHTVAAWHTLQFHCFTVSLPV